MPPPIRELAQTLLTDPVSVAVAPESVAADRVEQFLYFVDKADKRRLLAELVRDKGLRRTLVFSRTKHGANRVAQFLERLFGEVPARLIGVRMHLLDRHVLGRAEVSDGLEVPLFLTEQGREAAAQVASLGLLNHCPHPLLVRLGVIIHGAHDASAAWSDTSAVPRSRRISSLASWIYACEPAQRMS